MRHWLRLIDVISTRTSLPVGHQVARLLSIIMRWSSPIYCGYLIQNISIVFSEKSKKCIKHIMINSQKKYFEFFSTYSWLSTCQLDSATKMLDRISICGLSNLRECEQSGRPVVVVSIHMGDFLLGFLKLASSINLKQGVGVIKWMAQSKKEDLAYKKFNDLGIDLSIFRLTSNPAIQILRFLRKGNIILTLCDISHHFVKTTQVSFFNRSAQFSCGPAELAIASGALVLPMVSVRKNGVETLIIEPLIDSRKVLKNGVSIHENATYLTQLIASFVESWIQDYPDQWHLWGVLGDLWDN